jgi:hypothetical protein
MSEETHGAYFVCGKGAGGVSGVSIFLGLTRILFAIAHSLSPSDQRVAIALKLFATALLSLAVSGTGRAPRLLAT